MNSYNHNHKLNSKFVMIIAALCSFAAIIFVLAIVIYANVNKGDSPENTVSSEIIPSISENKETDAYSGLHVDELSFFNKEKDENTDEISAERPEKEEPKEEELPLEATDGKHTFLVNHDESTEWFSINPYYSKCTYDFMNLVNSNDKMKYLVDNKNVGTIGAMLSRNDGVIDFDKLKDYGIDFVMLKVGERNVNNRKLLLDEKFTDNFKLARDSGLEIAFYFISDAKTEKEAKAEANFVLNELGDYKPAYPVCFVLHDMNYSEGPVIEKSRSDNTKIAKAFCKAIADKGFNSCIYGKKVCLLKEYDLSKLGDYDIFLDEAGVEVPDYPYEFKLWQYTSTKLEGITEPVKLILSFENYRK